MSRSKKIMALFLSIVMVLGLLPASAFAANDTSAFSDVKTSAWYHEDVQYVSENGLMKGTGENLFSPDATTTRGMIVTILYRLEGEPSPTGACPFQDVASGKYYEKAITWAAENGIVSGFSADTFGPDQNITREQMAAILYRYATYKKYDVSTAGDLSKFPDADKVSSYAVDAMKWANAAGLINGSSDGKLYPAGNATRAQVAAILTRFCKNIAAQCTVTFQLNYGSEGTYTTVKVAKGDTITAPKAPTRSGYTFSSWSEKTSGSAFDFKTPIEKDITLYAQWNKKSSGNSGSHTPAISNYTVTFESNGGSEVEKQVVKAGSCATRPNDPEREGYRLVAWYIDDALTTVYDFDEVVTADITLYAKWNEIVDEKGGFIDEDDPDIEIFSFDTDTWDIVVGETATVTFTAEVFAEIKIPENTVAVIDGNGTTLGYMHDDGIEGDITAGDGIYTLQVALKSEKETTVTYCASTEDVVSSNITIGYYIERTKEDYDVAQTVGNTLNDVANEFLDENGYLIEGKEEAAVAALSDKLDALIKDGTVNTYTVKGLNISIKLSNGVKFVYILLTHETDAGIGSGTIATFQPFKGTYSSSLNTKSDQATDGAAEKIVNELNRYVFKTNADLNQVTLDSLKNLSDYSVVLWHGHGGHNYIDNEGSCLATGQLVDSNTSEIYDKDISANRILLCTAAGRKVYAITGGFVQKHVTGRMDGAFLYLGACDSGVDMLSEENETYSLAQAFIDKGATAVVANDATICTKYNTAMEKDTITEMCKLSNNNLNYNTLAQALQIAFSKNGKYCCEERKAKPVIFPENNGSARTYQLGYNEIGYMSGSVKDASTAATISNALVRVYDNDGNEVTRTRTDRDGRYYITLSAGEYILKISAGSYKNAKMAVIINDNATTYNEAFLMISAGKSIGYINGTITNSITEAPVSDVTVKFRKNWNNKTGEVVASTSTNTNGYFEVNGLKVGLYTIEYYKYGYATAYKNITVLLGSTHNAVISPVASSGVYRIVLTWGENPNDLDSHVIGNLSDGSSFHTYYGDKSHYDGDVEVCNLDVDDTTSYGPETITLTPSTTAPYYYYVYRFSGSGSISTSGAQIKLYNGDTLVETFNAPTDQGTSDYWNVFAIVGGRLVTKNTITDSPDITYAGATGVVTLNLDEVEEKAIVP